MLRNLNKGEQPFKRTEFWGHENILKLNHQLLPQNFMKILLIL